MYGFQVHGHSGDVDSTGGSTRPFFSFEVLSTGEYRRRIRPEGGWLFLL